MKMIFMFAYLLQITSAAAQAPSTAGVLLSLDKNVVKSGGIIPGSRASTPAQLIFGETVLSVPDSAFATPDARIFLQYMLNNRSLTPYAQTPQRRLFQVHLTGECRIQQQLNVPGNPGAVRTEVRPLDGQCPPDAQIVISSVSLAKPAAEQGGGRRSPAVPTNPAVSNDERHPSADRPTNIDSDNQAPSESSTGVGL